MKHLWSEHLTIKWKYVLKFQFHIQKKKKKEKYIIWNTYKVKLVHVCKYLIAKCHYGPYLENGYFLSSICVYGYIPQFQSISKSFQIDFSNVIIRDIQL